jgi:OmcA/MtrC family decaheme c-type cytochrome
MNVLYSYKYHRSPVLHLAFVALAALAAGGCTGDTGPQGPPGPPGSPGTGSGGAPTNTQLTQGQSPPGVHVAIVAVTGATGPSATFQAGDHVHVTYTLTKTDGTAWQLSEMSSGRIMLSGPSFNYQRVLPQVTDVATASVANADGSFTYTFATAIPAAYIAPYNTTSPGTAPGDLTGQPLLAGTYTIGEYFSWKFTVDGVSHTDAGNAEADLLYGGATTLVPREAVKQDNCNQCHEVLQAHGGSRRDVKLCILCHTAGATDGEAQPASIEFKVMVHKIHNAAHLPSVLGVSTNPDGSRNYAAMPAPYVVNGDDFSDIHFPVWPNAQIPMPRDQGYSALPAPSQALEDTIREGAANCIVCHGDPDGPGPLTAPAQGDLYKAQPSREACGACHDDVIWGQPYTANMQTMPAQANDSNCALCHATSGNNLAVQDAHTHPLNNPTFNPGLHIVLSNLAEAGTNNGNGKIDPGEKIAITFTIKDDSGASVTPSSLASISAVLSGPSTNYNVLLNTSIPTAALTGAQPFTVNVPQGILYEFVGDSTGALDVFTTSLTPHLNVTGALTSVQVRTATSGGSSTLSAAAPALQNFVDVANPANFARNDFVVIDDAVAGKEEYLKIQWVNGNRLWFSSPATTTYAPGVRFDHAGGATVKEVTLTTKTAGTDYTLNAATGQINELVEFGAGNAVVVSYTTDFVMPSVYPVPLNGSPDLDDSWGKWTAKPIVAGTYSLGVWGQVNLTLNLYGESNSYRNTSVTTKQDFLVGSATTLEPYALISSGQNCQACHQDITFHGGGRRGFDACILCHGTAGSEDRPQYVAASAPATTGVTINFRTMLHKIHRGADLANASTYTVVGFGAGAYPNNFTANTYEDVEFPALPGGVDNCTKCHGDSNTAWQNPSDRNHPTNQVMPVRAWRAVCGACHDDDAAAAHIDTQTSPSGVEACGVCHGTGGQWAVQKMHKPY